MACICFYPRFSLFVFLLWRSVVALRRLLMHVRGANSGASLLLPGCWLLRCVCF